MAEEVLSAEPIEWKVLLPAEGSFLASIVNAGSGLATGSILAGDRITVDYEGAVYGQEMNYAEKCMHAVGRQASSYPTGSRIWPEPADVVQVGIFDALWGVVRIDPEWVSDVSCWLGVQTLSDSQLQANGAQYEARRELAGLRQTDPAKARWFARSGPDRYRQAGLDIGLS